MKKFGRRLIKLNLRTKAPLLLLIFMSPIATLFINCSGLKAGVPGSVSVAQLPSTGAGDLLSSAPTSNRVYNLHNIALSQNLALQNGSSTVGNPLILSPDNGAASGQQFKVIATANGDALQEQTGGLCLALTVHSIALQICNASDAETFLISFNSGNGTYVMRASDGTCVTGQGTSSAVGSEACDGSHSSQSWYFEAPPNTATTTSTTLTSAPTTTFMPPPTPVGSLATHFRLMTLGDSMTGGYGGTDQQGYRGPLYNMLLSKGYSPTMTGQNSCGATSSAQYPLPSDQLGCDGIGGEQIAALDSSVVAGLWVAKENPDVVLLWIGFNSIYYTSNSTAQNQADLSKLLNDVLAQKPSARVIVAQLVASTQCCSTSQLADYNAGIPAIVNAQAAKGFAVSLVNLYGSAGNPLVPPADLYDYVHPNDAGYVLVANAWLQAILSAAK